jgi:threonine dehydrogenase-like Zn-dependent dehydrogenase
VIREENDRIYPVPEGIDQKDAAAAHLASFPMLAIRKLQIQMGEACLIAGQGLLGLIAGQLARIAGAYPVIVSDCSPERRELALQLGADYALDPMAPDYVEKVIQLTDGRGPETVVEVTGNGKALDVALDAIAPFGRLALLGCTRNSDFTINYYRKVHGRGVTMIGAHTDARPDNESSFGWWTTRDDALAFLKLLEHKRIFLDGFVDEVHPPTDCADIYARLARSNAFPVLQFDWENLS